MFDFNTCNHMARFVLTENRVEDPGPHHFWSRLRWSICDLNWHIDPLCIFRGYVCV
jgi:hypothetical protein